MNLLMRKILNTVCLKNIANYESKLIRTQYYTCLSSICCAKLQTEKNNRKQQISSLKAVRELTFDFRQVNKLILNTFDKLYGGQKYKQKHVGFLWYHTFNEININDFFTLLELPDTFYSWCKVIQLHVWMLMFRMQQDEGNYRYVRDGLVEAMWLDMETRAREIGKLNKNFKKNLRQIYNMFKQQSLFWYDHGFLENDMVLTTVVWSLIFERNCDNPEKLEALVRFIRFQVKHLESFNTKNLEEVAKSGVWTSLRPHCQRLVK